MWARVLARRRDRGSGGGGGGEGREKQWHSTGGGGGETGFAPDFGRDGQHPPLAVAGTGGSCLG